MKKPNCIFCQFAGPKKEKYRRLFESSDLYILLSLNPQTPGHSLIIPKKHFNILSLVSPKEISKLFNQAVTLGEQLMAKLGAKAYTLKVNNNLYQIENSGHLEHIHIHVIPRYKKQEKISEFPKKATVNKLKLIKKIILEGGDKYGK